MIVKKEVNKLLVWTWRHPTSPKVVQAQIQGVESRNKRRLGSYGGMESGYKNHKQMITKRLMQTQNTEENKQ